MTDEQLAQKLREKGLNCNKLKSMINNKKSDARMFQRVGFNKLSQKEIETAMEIESVRRKVCRKL